MSRTHKNIAQLLLGIALLSTSFFAEKNIPLQNWDAQWTGISLPFSTLENSAAACARSDQYWLACKQAAEALTKFSGHNADALNIQANTDFPALFRKIREEYYHGSVPSGAVAAGWNALLHAFDPHANLIPFAAEEELAAQSSDSFTGIGLKTQAAGNHFRVASVVAGAPAELAGIQAGDKILAINSTPTESIASEHLFQFLQGNPGSKVNLSLENQGCIKNISLTREQIKIPVLQTKVLRGANDSRVGYLALHNFSKENVCSDIQHAIEQLQKQNVQGFILDLRGNPGGYVREAQCTGSLFLGHGKLFASFRKINNPLELIPQQRLNARAYSKDDFSLYTLGAQITKLPLLVLVNRNTASAAEVLTAALQDHARALVQGEQSFGKGLMQTMFAPWDNSAIVLAKSTHEIYRPSGAPLQLYGVLPSIGGAEQKISRSKEAFLLREEDLQKLIPRQ